MTCAAYWDAPSCPCPHRPTPCRSPAGPQPAGAEHPREPQSPEESPVTLKVLTVTSLSILRFGFSEEDTEPRSQGPGFRNVPWWAFPQPGLVLTGLRATWWWAGAQGGGTWLFHSARPGHRNHFLPLPRTECPGLHRTEASWTPRLRSQAVLGDLGCWTQREGSGLRHGQGLSVQHQMSLLRVGTAPMPAKGGAVPPLTLPEHDVGSVGTHGRWQSPPLQYPAWPLAGSGRVRPCHGMHPTSAPGQGKEGPAHIPGLDSDHRLGCRKGRRGRASEGPAWKLSKGTGGTEGRGQVQVLAWHAGPAYMAPDSRASADTQPHPVPADCSRHLPGPPQCRRLCPCTRLRGLVQGHWGPMLALSRAAAQ